MSGMTSAVPPFQKALMNFLDNYAPVVGEYITFTALLTVHNSQCDKCLVYQQS